jgi:hypothetical protein
MISICGIKTDYAIITFNYITFYANISNRNGFGHYKREKTIHANIIDGGRTITNQVYHTGKCIYRSHTGIAAAPDTTTDGMSKRNATPQATT